jgi:predicted GIY-YIG superfamily endonuclease
MVDPYETSVTAAVRDAGGRWQQWSEWLVGTAADIAARLDAHCREQTTGQTRQTPGPLGMSVSTWLGCMNTAMDLVGEEHSNMGKRTTSTDQWWKKLLKEFTDEAS